MPHLAIEQLTTQAALPFRLGKNNITQVRFELAERCLGRLSRLLEPRQHRPDVGIALGLFARLDRVVRQLRDAREVLQRSLRMELRNRPIAQTLQLTRGDLQQARHGLEAPGDRRQSRGWWGELAGQDREDAAAQEVNPRHRIPPFFPELRIGEAHRGELGEEDLAVGSFTGRQAVGIELLQLRLPAIDEREPCLPACLGHVRPGVIEPVIARRGSAHGVEREQLVEEGCDARLYRRRGNLGSGHWFLRALEVRHRLCPGSCRQGHAVRVMPSS